MDVRWWILLCCCTIGFSVDFFSEEPSTLVQRLTGTAAACQTGEDQCTYLDIKQFNLLFSANAFAAALGAICAGLIIDRYGCKFALWASAACNLVGGTMFVGGTYIPQTAGVFGVMIVGNVIAGIGGGAISVMTHRVKASWFLYKELALAFSIHIFCGRLGSASSYLLIGALVEKIGLHGCLWIGFGLNVLASVAAITMSILDEKGAAMVRTAPPTMSTGIVWGFVKSLDGVMWCFLAMVFLYYGTVSTFTANGPNFLAKVYGYSESVASYLVGIVYDVALFSVLFGWLIDRHGKRERWLTSAAGLLLLAFVLVMAIPQFPAWLLTLLIGFGYTIFGPTFWSSVPLVVLPSYVGTALGTSKFCQYAGTGTLTAIAGAVLEGNERHGRLPWGDLMIQLLVTAAVCLLATGLMIYFNVKTGKRLTPSQAERDQGINGLQEVTPIYVDYGMYDKPDSVRQERRESDRRRRSTARQLSEDLTRLLIRPSPVPSPPDS